MLVVPAKLPIGVIVISRLPGAPVPLGQLTAAIFAGSLIVQVIVRPLFVSMSATLTSPLLNVLGVSSVRLKLPGTVNTGASFTAATFTTKLPMPCSNNPSVTVRAMVALPD